MSFKLSASAPLSPKQKTVWSLIRKGLSVSAIATKLNATRQYINQTRLNAEAKLSTTLLDVAGTNDIQITKMYPKKAILLGYHPGLKRKAIITYTTSHGIKVWYWNDKPETITNEKFLNQTRKYVLEIAKEQGIELDTKEIHPAKLAHILFNKLVPEVSK
ncbi:helix-turn-helix transcriptional regulator [Thermoproteota archaeon]